MADNDPTSWPPEPQTGPNQTATKPANKAAGWVSLGLAVLLLLVEVFTALAFFSASDGPTILGVIIHSSPGLLGLWIGAIVTGFTGRRSLPGKIGLSVSLVDLVAYGYLAFQYSRIMF